MRVFIAGAAPIELRSFAGVSAGTAIFSSNDDHRGGWLTGPTVPHRFRHVAHASVLLEEHAIGGAGCVILPGVTVGRVAAVVALTAPLASPAHTASRSKPPSGRREPSWSGRTIGG